VIFETGRIDALGWLFVVLPIVAVFAIVWVASAMISSIGQRRHAAS
jgi:hypothetical protein